MKKRLNHSVSPDFSVAQHTKLGKNILNEPKIYVSNERKIYQMAVKQTKYTYKYTNQHFQFQDHPKFSQNSDFDLKINHLATLDLV
jgi:hypothetical protein